MSVLKRLAQDKKDAASTWADVYISRDKGHSYIPPFWTDTEGGRIVVRDALMHTVGGNPILLGSTCTSQSTTGMGHDLAGNGEMLRRVERVFYFAGNLLAGPAHISHRDVAMDKSDDTFQAHVPCLFNSMGSSKSETTGLAKMLIAGGYLSKDLKKELKKHGLYASTLLYLWKVGLPYDVPYEHELRHRVAYNSRGDHSDYPGPTVTDTAVLYHNYDDDRHMMNMARAAADLKAAPPVAVLRVMRNDGGTPVYFLKTAALIKQKKGEDISLRVSTADCYDLSGLPLSFQWKVLYGHQNIEIKQVGEDEYDIHVPYDKKLPRGRTALALFPHNGKSGANPAIITIYRDFGHDNKRPSISGLEDQGALPGEDVRIPLRAVDPEGFPVQVSQWGGQVGKIEGSDFVWKVPPGQPAGRERVTVIASDNTSGNSMNAAEAEIKVSPILADFTVDGMEGKAPFTVRFDGSASRDVQGGVDSFSWDFGAGASARGAKVSHTFSEPGYHMVKLRVEGPSGKDALMKVVRVENDWPSLVENGWNVLRLQSETWSVNATKPPLDIVRGALTTKAAKGFEGGLRLRLKEKAVPPLYVEAVFSKFGFDASRWGFEVLGAIIGHAAAKKVRFQRSVDFAAGEINEHIAPKPRTPWCDIHLRMYVRPEPGAPDVLRYTGFVHSGTREEFFTFTHSYEGSDEISILTGNPGKKMSLRRFIVRSPSGKIPPTKRLPASKSMCRDYRIVGK
jgi:PKD repeat protein